jgi:uncharacterized protein
MYSYECMETVFTWDPAKAARNLRKHGVSFEQAKQAFTDPNQFVTDDWNDSGEQRWQLIGYSNGLTLLLVVFVDRSSGEVETIHIISARKANAYEEETYRQHLS